MSEKCFIQYDVENEKLRKENENENEKLETRNKKVETRNEKVEMTNENNIIKGEPKEIKSLHWFDKNKFKEIVAIIDSKEFTYRHKIDEFKYDNIKDLVNNIRNNTISEIDAKKGLNKLNEIKNIEIIKYKKCTAKNKTLLNLFNNLSDVIITGETLKSQENENEKVENEKAESRKEENEDNDYGNKYENEDEDDYYENENEDENENKDEDETMSQKIIKNLNDNLDEIIDKSKSFEDQIKSIRKVENLNEYYFINDYGDKELEFKIFKLKLAHLSNIIDKKLFKQIFGHTFETLANKLINTTKKEENQIIVNNINKNKEKVYKQKKETL